nr:MAG TPA: hypothetical protein [Bacteriophage sp.]
MLLALRRNAIYVHLLVLKIIVLLLYANRM